MKRFVFLLAIGTIFALGCGGNKATPGNQTDILTSDQADGQEGVSDVTKGEFPGTDNPGIADGGADSSDSYNDAADVVGDSGPKKGRLGWQCNDNSDCQSGICIDSRDGKVCTEFCMESCPAGWACKSINWSGDDVFVCLPRFLTLCDPCNTAADCNTDMSAGGAGCIPMGADGSFCGGDCTNSDCPDGYQCKDVSLPQGVKKQCVPISGKCECSKRAIALSLSTKCYVKNDAGKCMGTRTCTQTGLSKCDAKTPKPEECNKIDDDCNGLTDDGLSKVPCVKKNDYGTCTGTGKCVDGQIVECNAPKPGPEKCDGLDNNCDGQTDEDTCYDGDPCTEDKCDPSTNGCVYAPLSGVKCDDGNLCTTGDHCANGKCVGGVKKNCDDGNPCTDDSCDPSTGKCIHRNNSAPCDDGNPCTEDDHCLNGQCQRGSPKQCPNNPPCKVNGKCNPQTGACDYTYNDGMSCDDDDVCTVDTTCTGGKCGGGGDYCGHKPCNPGNGQIGCFSTCVPVLGLPTCPCVCL